MWAGRLVSLLLLIVLLAGVATLGACDNNGSYRLGWSFVDPAATTFEALTCGTSGVSSIAIDGTKDDGSKINWIVPCSPGGVTRSAPSGHWTLAVTAVDAEGHAKETMASTGNLADQTTVTIVAGETRTTDKPTLFLRPLPECRDGVDNDCDGRVDLDDPDCQVPAFEDMPATSDVIERGAAERGCSFTDAPDAGSTDTDLPDAGSPDAAPAD